MKLKKRQMEQNRFYFGTTCLGGRCESDGLGIRYFKNGNVKIFPKSLLLSRNAFWGSESARPEFLRLCLCLFWMVSETILHDFCNRLIQRWFQTLHANVKNTTCRDGQHNVSRWPTQRVAMTNTTCRDGQLNVLRLEVFREKWRFPARWRLNKGILCVQKVSWNFPFRNWSSIPLSAKKLNSSFFYFCFGLWVMNNFSYLCTRI